MERVGKLLEVILRSPQKHSLYLGMPQVCTFLMCAQWEDDRQCVLSVLGGRTILLRHSTRYQIQFHEHTLRETMSLVISSF